MIGGAHRPREKTVRKTKSRRARAIVGLAWVLAAAASSANGPAAPAAEPETMWNEMQGEKLQALRARGDPARGEIAFEVCQGCHRAHGLGRPDGSYPRLAGQHDTVLIKQMTDVRAGRRRNDRMLPFIERHGLGPQDIADIAAYLSRQSVPPDNGKGPGVNVGTGETIYQDKCASCHGTYGEGDGERFYPRVSGQHYKYLLHEERDIRAGLRANADSRMVERVKPLSDAELDAVADYMSRLPVTAPR